MFVENMSEQRFILSVLPFLVSFFIGLVSPFLDFLWECQIHKYAGERQFDEEITENYLNFARKATASLEMSTALLLTSVSGLVALVFNRGIALWIFGILTFLSVLLIIWLNVSDPHEHRISGIGPYTPDSLYTMLLNGLFILAIYGVDIGIVSTSSG